MQIRETEGFGKQTQTNAAKKGHFTVDSSRQRDMSARSPATDRDPFQLERLAEELEIRELNPHVGLDSPSHDLPILVPLSHSNPYITAPTFNVEEFLLSRSHTSLPDLRTELRDYLGMLKEELVKLINDDYEAFISLSTDLRGEGARLERLKFPLGMLKSEILVCMYRLRDGSIHLHLGQVSKGELQVIQDAIQEKLKKRAILREEKVRFRIYRRLPCLTDQLIILGAIASPPQDIRVSDASGVSSAHCRSRTGLSILT